MVSKCIPSCATRTVHCSISWCRQGLATCLYAALLIPGAVTMPYKHKHLGAALLLWCLVGLEEGPCAVLNSLFQPRPFQLLWGGSPDPERITVITLVAVTD